jgi:hypothetical protein
MDMIASALGGALLTLAALRAAGLGRARSAGRRAACGSGARRGQCRDASLERLERILRNIEVYDGTGRGQKPVD